MLCISGNRASEEPFERKPLWLVPAIHLLDRRHPFLHQCGSTFLDTRIHRDRLASVVEEEHCVVRVAHEGVNRFGGDSNGVCDPFSACFEGVGIGRSERGEDAPASREEQNGAQERM